MSLPADARVFTLSPGTKIPPKGSHGHLEASIPSAAPSGEYGVALDGQFLVVDYDQQEGIGAFEGRDLPPTWRQRTRRGEHWLYRIPKGVDTTRARNSRFPGGDVKVRGYIVGPGSTVAGHLYTEVGHADPVEAPSWLWEYVCNPQLPSDNAVQADLDSIGEGSRDTSLVQIGGLLRRMGLNEGAIANALGAVNSTIIEPPLETADIARISRSVARYEPDTGAEALAPSAWASMEDIEYAGPPTRWWVRGFVPRGELVMLFGPGSVGKSSWGSWLASQVTSRGGRIAVISVEEPVKRFAWRAQLNGATLAQIIAVPKASTVQFPRDAPALREALLTAKIDLLYIDSIYSHFESGDGLNAAERARRCLSPLAEIAQETGVTIVCVFHENKAGSYLGSVEMINVARYVLEAQRNPPGPLHIGVKKTNLFSPGYKMAFEGTEVLALDPHTGEVQREEDDDGNLVPQHFTILNRVGDVKDTEIEVTRVRAEPPVYEVEERPYVEEKLYVEGKVSTYRENGPHANEPTVYRRNSQEDHGQRHSQLQPQVGSPVGDDTGERSEPSTQSSRPSTYADPFY